MPKLAKVTDAELSDLIERTFDVTGDAADFRDRIEKGYCDSIKETIGKARSLQNAARTLLDLSSALLMKSALDEQKAELEALLRARTA